MRRRHRLQIAERQLVRVKVADIPATATANFKQLAVAPQVAHRDGVAQVHCSPLSFCVLPAGEHTGDRLQDEGQTILAAQNGPATRLFLTGTYLAGAHLPECSFDLKNAHHGRFLTRQVQPTVQVPRY
jgi:hypothetical protein